MTNTQTDIRKLEDLQPGDIWWVSYWRSFDRVLEIKTDSRWGATWAVVQQVRKGADGWEIDGEVREHCTQIDRRDNIIRLVD